jgi:hypothetical protein
MLHRLSQTYLLIGLIFLVSCGQSDADYPSDSASEQMAAPAISPQYAEMAEEFIHLQALYPWQEHYSEEYYDAKIAAGLLSRDWPSFDGAGVEELEDGSAALNVYTCEGPEAVLSFSYDSTTPPPPEEDNRVDEFAVELVALEKMFRDSGYAPAVFETPLAELERAMLEYVTRTPFSGHDAGADSSLDNLYSYLASEVEGRRGKLQPDKPKIIANSACGGGETEVYVRTEPPNGRVWMTSAHSFYRCALRSSNPWHLDSCRWSEISADLLIAVSGRRFYQVRWPDGQTTRGDLTFQYSDETIIDGNYYPTVFIRR